MVETLLVGRIGKPHGIKGEVTVQLHTDDPEHRFAVGTRLQIEPEDAADSGQRSLSVESTRWHQGRLLVRFVGIDDRNTAEQVRSSRLVIPLDPHETPQDPEEFYDHQLIGLRVVTTAGELVGELAEVVHGPAQDLLVISTDGPEVLVPFVVDLVPEVDVAGGRIVVEDRPGLLDNRAD